MIVALVLELLKDEDRGLGLGLDEVLFLGIKWNTNRFKLVF